MRILRCKVGTFTFDKAETLSLCKLVRDTVMGQILVPKENNPRVFNQETARSLIRASESAVLAQVGFDFEIRPEYMATLPKPQKQVA